MIKESEINNFINMIKKINRSKKHKNQRILFTHNGKKVSYLHEQTSQSQTLSKSKNVTSIERYKLSNQTPFPSKRVKTDSIIPAITKQSSPIQQNISTNKFRQKLNNQIQQVFFRKSNPHFQNKRKNFFDVYCQELEKRNQDRRNMKKASVNLPSRFTIDENRLNLEKMYFKATRDMKRFSNGIKTQIFGDRENLSKELNRKAFLKNQSKKKNRCSFGKKEHIFFKKSKNQEQLMIGSQQQLRSTERILNTSTNQKDSQPTLPEKIKKFRVNKLSQNNIRNNKRLSIIVELQNQKLDGWHNFSQAEQIPAELLFN